MDKFKRVLIKISGEALAGEKKTGYDFDLITSVCQVLRRASEQGTQIAIVIGGGNFWRGGYRSAPVCDVLRQLGAKARVMTAVDIMGVGERYDTRRAIEYLEAGEIVLFAGGSGAPFFSTDTAAALRAAEIHADAILLAKNIDGVYSDDPRKNPEAVKFDRISYAEMLARRLAVMDTAATALAMENDLPVAVFALADPENILRVLAGENVGTIVE